MEDAQLPPDAAAAVPPAVASPAAEALPSPHAEFELPLTPFQGTPEEIERQWYEQVYLGRGDSMRQLTWRAVIMGSVLGSLLSLTNLYIGLKSGWGFGVAITACILSYAIWNVLLRIGLVRTPMTILENNCMQSTASSAGYSTGGTLISAFAAYMMLNNHTLPLGTLLAWVFFLAVLGVTMAIPMKRQMINVEQLRFPSGIAAAETLRALHSHGASGLRAARALGIAGVLAAINKFWGEGLGLIGSAWEKFSSPALVEGLHRRFLGRAWPDSTLVVPWDPLFMAAGVLTGLRIAWSTLLGGTLCWAVFVPILRHHGVMAETQYKGMVLWTLWGGVACMISSSLLSLAFQWRSIGRALGGVKKIFVAAEHRDRGPLDELEAPVSWFVAGQLISLVALAFLAHATFDMPYWQTTLAVLFSFVLALVACRITGETDTTPIGAMGKVTQLVFGAISPHKMNINLMSANITAGAAGSAADLLTDLKSGYLLGANPRKQFLAQFAGIFAGTVVTVLAFRLMVPDASVLGGAKFPAPAAVTWRAVAEAMGMGLSELHPVKAWSILAGGLVGIALTLLPRLGPRWEKWVPSPSGFGLAWTFPWFNSAAMFLGGLIGYGFEKRWPKPAKEYTFPVASGVIAGDALMGVFIIFCEQINAMVLGH